MWLFIIVALTAVGIQAANNVTTVSPGTTAPKAATGYSPGQMTSTNFGSVVDFEWEGAQDPTLYQSVQAEIMYWDDHICRIRINAVNTQLPKPYVVPDDVFEHSTTKASSIVKAENPAYSVALNGDDIEVQSKKNSEVLFRIERLKFGEQLLQFSSPAPVSSFITGWGERNYWYFLNQELINVAAGSSAQEGNMVSLNMWNTDQGTVWQGAMYGYHPFVLVADPTTNTFSCVFILQSHVSNLYLSKQHDTKLPTKEVYQMDFTFGGGLLDAFVITGATMREVVTRYHNLIGTAMVPPYWSLGTHQSRWNYKTLTMLEDVVGNYSSHGIPLETIWSDNNPTMPSCSDFFINETLYPMPSYREFVDKLLNRGQHYVQITDPFIGISKDNPVHKDVFLSGLDEGIYINRTDGMRPLVATGWPGWTTFVDFTAEKARQWWGKQVWQYRQRIPMSGQWVDEAEISCNVGCPTQCPNAWIDSPFPFSWWGGDWNTFDAKVCQAIGNCNPVNSPLNFPKVNPLMIGQPEGSYWYPYNKTIDMTGECALGKVYSTKAFYGMMAGRAAADAFLNATKKRPFVLARASYAGAGKWMAHWTGDNWCRWSWKNGGLGASWQMVLASNLWGITMIGSDTCGFAGETTQELCTRWYQSGTFYTFFRNHHTTDDHPQEPYRFQPEAQAVMKQSIFKRYELLPVFFSALMESHLVGGPALRHLSMEFPTDSATYVESVNFMVGSDLLVVPIVTEGAVSVEAYMPTGVWYDIWTHQLASRGSEKRNYSALLYVDPLPAFYRGGRIFAQHTTPLMTVRETRQTGISLVCALDANNHAESAVWFDDGHDNVLDTTNYRQIRYVCDGNQQSGTFYSTTLVNPLVQPHELPLKASATLTILFPTSVAASKTNLMLNGENIELVQTLNGSALTIALPTHIDGTVDFVLQWTTPSTSPSKTDDKRNVIVAVGVVAGVLALGCIVLLILLHRARRTRVLAADEASLLTH